MPEILAQHSYLICSLALTILVVVLARCALSRAQFFLTVLSGLLGVPAFVFGYFLEGNYWHPARLGGASLGVEDALISFAMSALAWLVVALVFGRRLEFRFRFWRSLKRYAGAAIFCDVTFLLWVWAGFDGMSALLLAYAVATPALWLLRRANWPLAALGVPLFAAAWFCVVKTCVLIFPESVFHWNLTGRWGATIAGVPCGELVWAAFFGAFWPLFTAFVYELGWTRAPHASSR